MKKCYKCKKLKTVAEFSKCKSNKDGLQDSCKECQSIAKKNHYSKNRDSEIVKSREYRAQNPNAGRNSKYKTRYSISLEEYNRLALIQDFKCAICGQEEDSIHGKSGEVCRLSVDHCHVTGTVRGLLCGNCNKALGLLKDSPIIVSNLLKYLQKAKYK